MTNEIKLIVTDVDGTLINDNDELPENFLEFMAELEKRNIVFVAASGRGVASIENKLQYKSDNLYIISDNGSVLKHQDEIFFENSFNKDEVKEIVEVFRQCNESSISGSMIDSSRVELHPDHSEEYLKEFMSNYIIVDDITKCDEHFVKIGLRSDYHTTENYNKPEIQALKKKYYLVRTGPPWINIMRADSNKGNALEFLLEHLDIPKENTIGFGDFPNDIHMLEVVGKSYAMAESVESVIEMADEVIGSNNDNSVMNKIIELLDLDI